MGSPTTRGKRRVAFKLLAAPGSEVYVAGTFNGWDETRKRLFYKDGVYTATMMLERGRHEYKFIIDGIWCVDPDCPDWVPNDQGSLNSVITVE